MESSNQTFEDICFFDNNKKLIMGTVTHEYISHAFPVDSCFEEKILSFGNWIYRSSADVLLRYKAMITEFCGRGDEVRMHLHIFPGFMSVYTGGGRLRVYEGFRWF